MRGGGNTGTGEVSSITALRSCKLALRLLRLPGCWCRCAPTARREPPQGLLQTVNIPAHCMSGGELGLEFPHPLLETSNGLIHPLCPHVGSVSRLQDELTCGVHTEGYIALVQQASDMPPTQPSDPGARCDAPAANPTAHVAHVSVSACHASSTTRMREARALNTLETETASGDGYPGGLLLMKITKPCTHETEDMHDKMEN